MDINKLLGKTKKIQEDLDVKIDYEIQNTVEASNQKIVIFKRIPNENFFYPYNKTAIKYCIDTVSSNISKLDENVNYRLLESQEKHDILNQYNLLLNLFNDIKIKKNGKIKITQDIMIFDYSNGNLIPLNKNSSINFLNIYQLISNTPKINKNLWEKLKIKL